MDSGPGVLVGMVASHYRLNRTEGAKHQVNHMFQDIDLVLIYRREKSTKLNTCPGGWNGFNLSKGTKLNTCPGGWNDFICPRGLS